MPIPSFVMSLNSWMVSPTYARPIVKGLVALEVVFAVAVPFSVILWSFMSLS